MACNSNQAFLQDFFLSFSSLSSFSCEVGIGLSNHRGGVCASLVQYVDSLCRPAFRIKNMVTTPMMPKTTTKRRMEASPLLKMTVQRLG